MRNGEELYTVVRIYIMQRIPVWRSKDMKRRQNEAAGRWGIEYTEEEEEEGMLE